jgi:hypothetical protein
VAHDQAAGIGPGHETVVLAAVDLHLVLVEHVPQVARDQAQGQGFALRALEGVGGVGQVGLVLLAAGIVDAFHALVLDHHAVPGRRQFLEQAAVAVALLVIRWLERGERLFQAGEIGEEIVEAAVLGVDHHDGLDVLAQGAVQRADSAGLPLG